ncbi:unnamed protein product [Angiostrongylus costaricensis]|uniref:Mitochondrial import inner membrane translocase subunit TIM50 n=1 Tax=Angiostrongylus costaricensis TaxID=334426 RepID=A0A158PF64_ANGCS|nr:unnamed protein product [Angiostrongylus costaricensis]
MDASRSILYNLLEIKYIKGSAAIYVATDLTNCRDLQDSYVDFLKSKYPMWIFSLTTNRMYKTDDLVINQLATSDYNWDEEWDRRTKIRQSPGKPRLHEEIPNSGPLLKSDVARVRHRLTDIARQLRALRETRLNLSTEDYLRTRVQLAEHLNDNDDILLAVRNRLSNISLTSFGALETPTAEKISVMKHDEQRDAYIADVRAGRITLGIAVPERSIIQTSSTHPEPVPSEPKNYFENEERNVHLAGNSEAKPLANVQHNVSDNENRVTVFEKDEAPKPKAETMPDIRPAAPPALTQMSSAYQKMVGLFGQTNTSDTDDDAIVPTRATLAHENPRSTAMARKSTAEQKSARTLAQYLSTNTKSSDVSTLSDSDDDFFK